MRDKESQKIEFKLNWRDEYLKTLCAFANTDGGSIYIGMSDKGEPVGLENADYLLETLPNKIRNSLNFLPSVKVEHIKNTEIIKIEIPPSEVPISYNGKYYIRSGSTTQELKGNELSRLLLKKMGKTWDSIPCKANLSEIKNQI